MLHLQAAIITPLLLIVPRICPSVLQVLGTQADNWTSTAWPAGHWATHVFGVATEINKKYLVVPVLSHLQTLGSLPMTSIYPVGQSITHCSPATLRYCVTGHSAMHPSASELSKNELEQTHCYWLFPISTFSAPSGHYLKHLLPVKSRTS